MSRQTPTARCIDTARRLAREAADRYVEALTREIPFDTAPGGVDLIKAVTDIQEALRPEDADPDHHEESAMNAGYLLGIEIGRRTTATPQTARPAIDRFFEAMRRARQHGTTGGNLTEHGVDSALAQLREAIPVAESIALVGNPLDADDDALEAYIQRKTAEVDARPENPTDPGHACDKATAAQDAVYFTALALGLILADRV